MPPAQLFFLALAIVIWVVGVNLLFVQHCRRLGKPIWRKLIFPYSEFNTSEWRKFFGVLALGWIFGAIALFLGPK